jgi:hypothetical protein
MLLINKDDSRRPLDAREGGDPFGGADPNYRCDSEHHNQGCFIRAGACPPDPPHTATCATKPVMPMNSSRHHELLGGHGSDTIYGGGSGDVLWGDYHASGQPPGQIDHITGGAGSDFIYASHGTNVIHTGGGAHDVVHARYGRGDIYCDTPSAIANLSRRSRPRYTLHGCTRVTLAPAGTQEV